MDLSVADHALAALAAVAAGLVNAVAGGGTLITFPTLIALGIPAVSSNMTNTLALCPGYVGGTLAQRDDLAGQRRRVPALAVASASGGLIGSVLLASSSERLFRTLVPFLILGACLLLVSSDRIKAALPPRPATVTSDRMGGTPPSLIVSVFGIGVYAGYFGAGIGIIGLAVLSVTLDDTMVRINALKQLIAFMSNVVAALFFAFSGKVVFSVALVMAPASLLGGNLGGRLVQRLNPRVLRAVVVIVGVAVAINFWR
jgi:uncharacterized membrane protein YfcA